MSRICPDVDIVAMRFPRRWLLIKIPRVIREARINRSCLGEREAFVNVHHYLRLQLHRLLQTAALRPGRGSISNALASRFRLN